MGGAWLSLARRFSASVPGVNPALQMRSLAPSTVGEFEKERTRLGPKSDFFLAVRKLDVWRESVWKHAKACVTRRKPWELAALVQLSSVDNNYASLNIRHILHCSWLVVGLSNWAKRHFFFPGSVETPPLNHSPMEQYQTHILTRIMSMTTSG